MFASWLQFSSSVSYVHPLISLCLDSLTCEVGVSAVAKRSHASLINALKCCSSTNNGVSSPHCMAWDPTCVCVHVGTE